MVGETVNAPCHAMATTHPYAIATHGASVSQLRSCAGVGCGVFSFCWLRAPELMWHVVFFLGFSGLASRSPSAVRGAPRRVSPRAWLCSAPSGSLVLAPRFGGTSGAATSLRSAPLPPPPPTFRAFVVSIGVSCAFKGAGGRELESGSEESLMGSPPTHP